MVTCAIILAGGLGTRLKSVVSDVPKPMANVNGKPFLDYQFQYLIHQGIKEVILCTGYLHEKIEHHYGNQFRSLVISYSRELEGLGTGGAVKKAMRQITQKEVWVLNGDSFLDLEFKDMEQRHSETNAAATLAVRKIANASRYGSVILNQQQQITAFQEKNEDSGEGLINGGVYLINRESYVKNCPTENKFSIEKDFFASNVNRLPIYSYTCSGYFIDIGIPEDYQKAQHDFKKFTYQ